LYNLASWRERHGIAGGKTDTDAEVLDEAFKTTGAILMGRRMFDVGEGPWGITRPYHHKYGNLLRASDTWCVSWKDTRERRARDGK